MEYWDDYEVLRIETPEQLELRLPLAGFGPRFVAAAIDYMIVFAGTGILVFIELVALGAWLGISSGASGTEPPESMIILMVMIIMLTALLPQVFYFAIFEQTWQGQTPGKRVAGIRVIRRGGGRLVFRDVLIRSLLRIIDLLPNMGFVAWVSFFYTRYQQRLGDLAADTVVVREFSSKQPFIWAAAAPDSGGPPSPGRLTNKLVYAIGSYLSRTRELQPEFRERLSRVLINQLGYGSEGMSLAQREGYLATIMAQAMGMPAPGQQQGRPGNTGGGPLGGQHVGI
ncbi:RDD family protein [bacterium]|nr:RDD family protein [bacterium]